MQKITTLFFGILVFFSPLLGMKKKEEKELNYIPIDEYELLRKTEKNQKSNKWYNKENMKKNFIENANLKIVLTEKQFRERSKDKLNRNGYYCCFSLLSCFPLGLGLGIIGTAFVGDQFTHANEAAEWWCYKN